MSEVAWRFEVSVMTIYERLAEIERLLCVLVGRQQVREWYTTKEFARVVGKAEFTIREYCRLGRLQASRQASGRGAHAAWVISHAELQRYQREGLLPCQRPDRHVESEGDSL
jgi:hypothetical protein